MRRTHFSARLSAVGLRHGWGTFARLPGSAAMKVCPEIFHLEQGTCRFASLECSRSTSDGQCALLPLKQEGLRPVDRESSGPWYIQSGWRLPAPHRMPQSLRVEKKSP